ncbi:hypothetical protein ACNKHL_22165 [Shigella flexneri]
MHRRRAGGFGLCRPLDIGHSCVGARVDRQRYPLCQQLDRGQTVNYTRHRARARMLRG